MEHLSALRSYILMNAGDFIDNLATSLFEKVWKFREFFLVSSS